MVERMQSISFLFTARRYRCISAVFAVARCPSVCLSARLSVCHVGGLYPHLADDIVKLIYRPGSPITLVFFDLGTDNQFQREPFSGGAKYKGVGKFCNFRLKISVYLGQYEIGHGCYGTLIGNHLRSIEW